MVVAGPKVAVRIAQIQADAGVDEKEALKRLARELGQSKSDVYRELQRERARLSAGSRGTRNTP
jgi:16S rRNA (cytidine1402-2'-O)-methyltransferase